MYETFDELVEPMYDQLQGFTRKLTGDDFDAKLILSKAMSRGANKFDQFKQGTNFKAWMYRIIYNEFVSEYRKLKSAPQFIGDEELTDADLLAVDSLSASHFDDEDEDFRERVKSACEKLRPERREVLNLYYDRRMKYKEIAQHLDLPIGTVMSRLARAKRDLKESIKKGAGK